MDEGAAGKAATKRPPWQVWAGVAVMAASLIPSWTEANPPRAAIDVRLWTTAIVGALCVGVLLRLRWCRTVLAALLLLGLFFLARALLFGRTIDERTVVITALQMAGTALLFARPAGRWFAGGTTSPDAEQSDLQD